MEDYTKAEGDLTLAGADLSGTDLRHKDLSDMILFGTDLRGSKLYGAKVALRCESFDGVKLDDSQFATLLLMLQMCDVNPKFQVGLRDLVRRVTGDQHFHTLQRWLKLA